MARGLIKLPTTPTLRSPPDTMANDITAYYARLQKQAEGLFDAEPDFGANSANLLGLLFLEMPRINWVGYYWLREQQLVLGAFQGKPACTRIPMGQGVCGTAAASGKALVVDNVHEFDGHIACDGASNSEVVVPIYRDGTLLGVLDVDSPRLARFCADDALGLAVLVDTLVQASAVSGAAPGPAR